ncbi:MULTISPECIES: HNH endonuclease [unclassified Pseudomonas]|uniref:HNH endonuclease n=1 Tax=Pseudomonas TaxID=286 RepID=UPI002FCD8FFB
MAHVIPHGETGPRHEEGPAGEFKINSFENLILLCPTAIRSSTRIQTDIAGVHC